MLPLLLLLLLLDDDENDDFPLLRLRYVSPVFNINFSVYILSGRLVYPSYRTDSTQGVCV